MSDHAVSKQMVDNYIERPEPVYFTEGKPTLGQTCIVRGTAVKKRDGKWNSRRTFWVAEEIEPKEAIYIGWRVVCEGISYRDGDGYVDSFKRQRSFYVWLFVDNERRAPFYVFPRDVRFQS